jgi:hypothetical protein
MGEPVLTGDGAIVHVASTREMDFGRTRSFQNIDKKSRLYPSSQEQCRAS